MAGASSCLLEATPPAASTCSVSLGVDGKLAIFLREADVCLLINKAGRKAPWKIRRIGGGSWHAGRQSQNAKKYSPGWNNV